MSKKILITLAYISFAFNIAFVGMFIYHRFVLGYDAHISANCQTDQIEMLKNKYRREREFVKPKRMEFERQKREFIENLKSKDFNEKELREALTKSIKKQAEMEKEIGLRLIELRKQMTYEEAQYFFRNMNRFNPRFPFRKPLNRRDFRRRKK